MRTRTRAHTQIQKQGGQGSTDSRSRWFYCLNSYLREPVDGVIIFRIFFFPAGFSECTLCPAGSYGSESGLFLLSGVTVLLHTPRRHLSNFASLYSTHLRV